MLFQICESILSKVEKERSLGLMLVKDNECDIKIFVSHRIDLQSEIIDNPFYYNVRCGAVFDDEESDIPGDNTGDNISHKRETFNELTVQYWAWKNIDADYYGLCHYRRYFIFKDHVVDEDVNANCIFDYISEDIITKLGLDSTELVQEIVKSNDIILSSPMDLDVAPGGLHNLYEQYASSETLHVKDLKIALNVIEEISPEYLPYAKEYFLGKLLFPCNMFIMKRDLFCQYNSWLFTILKALEDEIDTSHYSLEENRVFGMIAERLLGVFMMYVTGTKPDTKVTILQRAVFLKPETLNLPTPFRQEKNIPIVLAFSEFYAPISAVMIRSIIDHSSKEYSYDFIVLNTGIEEKTKRRLQEEFLDHTNISIRFVNVLPFINSKKLSLPIYYISIESFYRLLIPKLFKNFSKVIYLDSDLIIQCDLSKLYSVDIKNNYIAATLDPDFIGQYNGATQGMKKYNDDVLKLKNPYSYFQTGVLLFNIDQIRFRIGEDEFLNVAEQKSFLYMDQDTLNYLCQGNVHYLDMEWNVLTNCGYTRIDHVVKRAPKDIYNIYLVSRNNPKILHYAGYDKPWDNPASDFAKNFWLYARKTSFYEELFQRLSQRESYHIFHNQNDNGQLSQKLIDRLLPVSSKTRRLIKFVFPIDSKRRKLIKRLLKKIITIIQKKKLF